MTDIKDKIYFLIERYEKAKERGDGIFKKEGDKECRRILVDAIIGNVEIDYKKKEK